MFFSRKNKGDPANVLLLYHGVAGLGMASFKAFPGPFWALSRPAPRSRLQPVGSQSRIQQAMFSFICKQAIFNGQQVNLLFKKNL